LVAVHQSTHNDYDRCVTEDCRSQLLFPVLSLFKAAPDEQSRHRAVPTGGTTVVSGWRTVAAATGSGSDMWPVPAQTAVNIINNNDTNNRMNNKDDTSVLAAHDYRYDDDDDMTVQLQYQDDTDNGRRQTVKSTTGSQRHGRFTGRFGVLLRYIIAKRDITNTFLSLCLSHSCKC